MGYPRAIIVDLDGTLYDSRDRQKRCFPEGGKKDFDRWNREANDDFSNVWCAELVQAMRATGVKPIFVSGRDVAYQAETKRWLKKYLNLTEGDYVLLMRPSGDYRKDSELKLQIYDDWIRPNYDILFCVDDRKQVVDMWRSIGLTCLQCAEGDF